MSWFERWSRRQDELAQGVDADLVRENRKQYKRAFWLLGFGFLLAFLMSKVQLAESLRPIVAAIAGGAGVAGSILLLRARQEEIALHKPAPEEPPQIFK
jgi:hypothetical protein